MNSLDTYLERAKIEELISQFTAEGYQVTAPDNGELGFDLVLRKGNRVIGVEVKTQDNLRESAEQLSLQRKCAQELGYDDFRLVVVRPPHEPEIEIEGLEHIFHAYLDDNMPPELLELAGRTIVDEVYEIGIFFRILDPNVKTTKCPK